MKNKTISNVFDINDGIKNKGKEFFMNIYNELKERLKNIVLENNLFEDQVFITTKSLNPKEAIGETKRKDFPILNGKENMIEAKFKGSTGQAFTSSPSIFQGSLSEVLTLDLNDDYNKAIFIATSNAILKYLGLIESTVHCKNEEPELCGEKHLNYLKEFYSDSKIALVGFQPSILEHIKDNFHVRVLDLNADNIGK
ncbi:hypothetical protein JTS93_00460 [Clostridium botulinum]|nr:hypothetical protein [Clostridium botulinum]